MSDMTGGPTTETEPQEPKTNHAIMYIGLGLIIAILLIMLAAMESKANFLEEKLLSNTELLYNHDVYIHTQIAKEMAKKEQEKLAAFKLYMETGDKSEMNRLGMK